MVKHLSALVVLVGTLIASPLAAHAHAGQWSGQLAALLLAAGAPDSGNTTVTANIRNATADGTSTVTLSTVVADASGDPISGQAVTVTVSGTGNVVGNASGKTDASGLFTTTLKSSKAEVKTITATVGSLSPTTTVTFKPGAPSSTISTLVPSPNNRFAADNNTTCTLTATVLDAKGNAISGANVTLAASGGNNTLGAPSGTSDANGVFTTTLKSSRAETKKITATVGSATFLTTVTFTPGEPDANKTTYVLSPNASVVADGRATFTLVTTVQDAFNNAVSGQVVSVASTGTGNTFSAASGATNANGIFSTTLRSTVAEVKKVTTTVGSLTHDANVTFVPGAAKVPQTYLTVSPNTIAADTNTTVTIDAVVADAYNNIIKDQAVSVAVSGSNNVVNVASGTTDANGTFASSFTSTKAEIKTITLKAGATSATAKVTVTPGSPNATASSFVATPNATIVANNTATVTLTTTVRDVKGNPVPDKAVNLASNGNGDTFSAANSNTNTAGIATSTLKSTVAQSKVVTLSGAIDGNATVVFVPGVGSKAASSIVATPNTALVADNSNTVTIHVAFADAQNNVLKNVPVIVKSTGTGNTLGAASGTTDPNGEFETTLKSSKAEVKTVSFSAGGATLTVDVPFVAGSPNATASTLVLSPKTAVANDTAVMTITGTIKDALGNPVASLPMTLTAGGGFNTLAASSGNTTAAGVFSTTLKTRKAETKAIALSGGNVTLEANATFTAGAGNTALSSLVANVNTTLVADANDAFTLTGTAVDALGNPLVNTAVSIVSTGTGNKFARASGVTDANGTFETTMTSTKAEAKTVTFKAGGAAPTLDVTFVAGSPNQKATTLVVTPAALVADGNTTAQVVATVRDAQQNPIDKQTIALAVTGGNTTLGATSGDSNAAGVFATTIKATQAGTKVVTLTIGSVTVNANVVFNAGAPDANQTTFVASPNLTTANNSNTVELTATVRDAIDNPVPNLSVALSANGTLNAFGAAAGKTNASGVFTTTLKSGKAELKAVTLKVGSLTLAQDVNFVPGPISAAKSTVVATPAKLVADNDATTTVKATMLDATGNPVPGTSVTITASGTHNTLGTATGTVDANGVYSTTIKSSHAEVKTITATAGSVAVSGNVTFVAGSPNSALTTLVVNPNGGVMADNKASVAITATVIDDFGNPVAGQAVTLDANGTGNAFSPAKGSTNASGVFTSVLKSTVAEAKAVTFSAGNVNVTKEVTFVPGAVSVQKSVFTLTPNEVTADGNTTMSVDAVLKDAYNNVISGQPFVVAVSGSENTLASGANGNTPTAGTIATSFTSTKAETKKVTITAGTTVLTASGVVKPGSPNETLSTLAQSPNVAVTADNSSGATFTATVMDKFSNPIANVAGAFSSTSTGAAFTPANGNTTATGTLVTKVKSSVAGTKVVQFKAGALTLSANATFVPGAANSVASDLQAEPRVGATADGSATVTLTAKVLDTLENPVSGQAVTLSSSVASDAFTSASGTTDANGVYTTTVKATVGGTRTVTLKAGAATSTTTVVFASSAVSALGRDAGSSRLAQRDVSELGGRFGALAALADLNGDGHLDVAFVDEDAATLQLMFGDGEGNFVPAGSYAAADRPRALAVGDVDGDGVLDVALANEADATVAIYAGNGDGSLQAPSKVAGVQAPAALALLDVNGDGRADVALASKVAAGVQVLENLGDAGYAWTASLPTSGIVTELVTADFDNDGRADLASANADDTVEIFFNRAEAGFAAPTQWHLPGALHALVAADVDGDGLVDLTSLLSADGRAEVLRSKGDGRFAWRGNLRLPVHGGRVLLGDVDGDRHLDLVSAGGAQVLSVSLGEADAPVVTPNPQ